MNRKTSFAAFLLTAALIFSACNKQTNDPPSGDSDTEAITPEITETVSTVPVPEIPVIDVPQTEPVQTETTAIPDETEPLPEITEPIPELPAVIPTEDTTAAVTEPTEVTEPVAPAPIVIVKPTVDISDQLVPGGEPVSGQCVSAQSENIRLLLDYTAEQAEDGSVTLTLNVGLSCYELWCSAKTDMGTITVNGVSRTFSTDAINHMTHEKIYIPFLTQTYNATGSQSASIEVSWNFNGTYGGTEIGTLTTGVILTYGAEGDTSTPSAVIEPVTPETEQPTEPTDTPQPDETEPVVPSTEQTNPVTPTDPGADTTPVPDVTPSESDAAEPNVTGTPEETVPTASELTPPPPEEAGTP